MYPPICNGTRDVPTDSERSTRKRARYRLPNVKLTPTVGLYPPSVTLATEASHASGDSQPGTRQDGRQRNGTEVPGGVHPPTSALANGRTSVPPSGDR